MSTSIYPVLNAKIRSILEGIPKIKEIHNAPAAKIDSYPAAIFFPGPIENSFETVAENFKVYNYKLYIVVNAGNKPVSEIFETVMPNVMDAVIEEFDKEWSFSNIGGHRVWCKIDPGTWIMSDEQAGLTITGDIDLQIKMLTTN